MFNNAYMWEDQATEQPAAAGPSVASAPDALQGFLGSQFNYAGQIFTPATMFVGIMLLLGLMRLAGDSTKTDIQGAHIQIGPYNFLAIGAISILAITFSKWATTMVPVPGLSELVAAA